MIMIDRQGFRLLRIGINHFLRLLTNCTDTALPEKHRLIFFQSYSMVCIEIPISSLCRSILLPFIGIMARIAPGGMFPTLMFTAFGTLSTKRKWRGYNRHVTSLLRRFVTRLAVLTHRKAQQYAPHIIPHPSSVHIRSLASYAIGIGGW